MKKIEIYKRTVLERTRYRNFRYQPKTEYIVLLSGETVYKGSDHELNDPKLRVKFEKVLETRKSTELDAFYNKLGKTLDDKCLKTRLDQLRGAENE